MSLTHPLCAWYSSSGGTSDPLAAAPAASGWAVLPSPLPGRKPGCTSTAVPPPPGSNDPSLCHEVLVRSDVWGLSVMQLFSVHLYLQSRVSSPVTSITVVRAKTAKKATQAEEEFVRCVVRGETWAGRANPRGAWLWLALDLLWLIKVPQARMKRSRGSDCRLTPGMALSCGGWLEVMPALREADGPFWNPLGENPWPRKHLLTFTLWIALLWGDRGQEVTWGHRLLSPELRGGGELVHELCRRAPLSQGLRSEEATPHIKKFVS